MAGFDPSQVGAQFGNMAGALASNLGGPIAALSNLMNGGAGVPGPSQGFLGQLASVIGRPAMTASTPAGSPGSSPYPGYLSPQEMQLLAEAQAKGQLQPMLDEIHYQQQQAAAQAAAQAQAIQGMAQAVADQQQKLAPQVQAGYQSAADATAGYGRAYGTGLQSTIDQNAQAANDQLATVAPNAPGRVSPGNGVNIGDLLFGIAGKGPADTLQAQGAAFGAAADLMPGATLDRGRIDAAAAASQGAGQQATLAHQADTYAAQTPTMVSNALNALVKQQQGLYNTDQTARYRAATLAGQAAARKQTAAWHQEQLAAQSANLALRTAEGLATQTGIVYLPGKNGQPAQVIDPTTKQPMLTNSALGQRIGRNITLAGQIMQNTGVVVKVDPATGELSIPVVKGQPVPTLGATKAGAAAAHTANLDANATARLGLARNAQKLALTRVLDQEQAAANAATTAGMRMAWQHAQADAAAKSKAGVIYVVTPDAQGNPVVGPWMVNGKSQYAKAKAAAAGGKLTGATVVKLTADANTIADQAFNGWTVDPKTKARKPATPMRFSDAVNALRQKGFSDALLKSIGIPALMRYYKNGSPVAQSYLNDPSVHWTLDGRGHPVAVRGSQVIGALDDPTDPGYRIAVGRAKAGPVKAGR